VRDPAPPQRREIVDALARALEPIDDVRAAWMMGSIAFERLDSLSDIDLVLDVTPGGVESTWEVIERTLEAMAPLDYRYEIPQPTWHGHEQRFFHLAGTPQHLLVDVVIMQSGHQPRLDEFERHGTPVILFDKDGIVVATHVDPDEMEAKLRTRLQAIKQLLPLAYSLVGKEIERGRSLDAFGFYQRFVVDNLVVLARMKHDPNRHDYGLRYLAFDVPEDLWRAIEACCYVSDLQGLETRFEVAKQLIDGLIADLESELEKG
jgi:predicted nucleotidyltransferase